MEHSTVFVGIDQCYITTKLIVCILQKKELCEILNHYFKSAKTLSPPAKLGIRKSCLGLIPNIIEKIGGDISMKHFQDKMLVLAHPFTHFFLFIMHMAKHTGNSSLNI